jgi:hypothetical protein
MAKLLRDGGPQGIAFNPAASPLPADASPTCFPSDTGSDATPSSASRLSGEFASPFCPDTLHVIWFHAPPLR